MKPTNHSTKISSALRAVSVASGITASVAAWICRSPTSAQTSKAAITRLAVAVCAGKRLSPGMIETQVNACSTSADSFRGKQLVASHLEQAGDQQQRHTERKAHAFGRQIPEQRRE